MTSDERKDKAPNSEMCDSQGFSLLEMMTVVALILILATISEAIYQTTIVRPAGAERAQFCDLGQIKSVGPGRATTMPSNRSEIIADIQGHIQKFGGGMGEWCVGTAKDRFSRYKTSGQVQNHLVADLGDGLIPI